MLENKSHQVTRSPCLPAGRQGYKLSVLFLLLVILFSIRTLSFSEEQFVYDAKAKRNPFIPLVSSDGRLLKLDREETTGELSIEGLIYDKSGRSFAIVNNTVVGIGDTVAGYQVLKIQDNKIIFIKDGQPVEVEIKKEEAK